MEATGAEQNAASGNEGEQAPNFAGFQTPEELAQAYQSVQSEIAARDKQIADLERIKGDNSGKISQLREQNAQLTGKLEGMASTAQQQQQGPTLDTIANALSQGKIDEATAIRMASQITEQNVATKLGAQFKKTLTDELSKRDELSARKDYVNQFIKENPGYQEAYDSGKLKPWIDRGLSGEEAWDKFQLDATRAELQALKQAASESNKKAEEAGLDKGIQLEKSKSAAGRVLNGKGGAFTQTASNYDLTNPNQRRQAGIERLNQLRGSSG
jgi:hypothetical protein